MNEAVKKAILDGGYRSRGNFYKTSAEDLEFALHDWECPEWEQYCLDPLFWQALGKATGWKEKIEDGIIAVMFAGRVLEGNQPEWLYRWHRFIDHLAEGKDAESFFNERLK